MEWLTTPAGQSLLQQEIRESGRALERVFGDQIIQIGSWGPPGALLSAARTQFSVLLGAAGNAGISAIVAENRLAILSDSVDAVLLPHTLDFSRDPHGILREVHRILRPDGKLIVLGFNPFSWWGLRHQFSGSGFPPGVRRQISQHRLADWLRLLSLSIDRVEACYAYSAATRPARLLRRLHWFASSYVLVATKEIIPMTIIRPRARRRASLVESFVGSTTGNVA
jgi:SAM-dependent methyltransferase